jgi:hypothetical protein
MDSKKNSRIRLININTIPGITAYHGFRSQRYRIRLTQFA